MASTSDIKNGLCIEYNGNLYFVTEFQHVKPGKGPAFVRTKLKNVKTGKVIDNTFPSGHKIVTARVEKRAHQFLYKDSSGYHFMDTSTYEQLSLEESQIDYPEYLMDGIEVEISIHTETGFFVLITYAIWSGMGILLISLIGYFRYNQVLDSAAILGMSFIAMGIIILRFFSKSIEV